MAGKHPTRQEALAEGQVRSWSPASTRQTGRCTSNSEELCRCPEAALCEFPRTPGRIRSLPRLCAEQVPRRVALHFMVGCA